MWSKSRIWLLLIAIGIEPSCQKTGESPTPLTDQNTPQTGLIAYFSFDKNDCRNDKGPGRDGTIKGNTRFSEGKKGRCLQLDGFGDYAELGTEYNLTNDFTIVCWINPDDISRTDAGIFAKFETNHYGPYDFYLSRGRQAFWISDGHGSYKAVFSNGTVKAEEWAHLAWVGQNNKIKLYINGILDTEETIPNMTSNNDLVTIGRQALLFTSNGSLEFKGKIDELKIYNRALSDSEVRNESN